MGWLVEPLLILALVPNFIALGVSRVRGVINAVALQGTLLGILTLVTHPDLGFRRLLLVAVTIGLKGFVIPAFLVHAVREADIQHNVTQVLGYLILENGIFLFGLLLLEAMPFLVEAGVLLDLFTGVFVMGIIIHHISREFASISTEHLSELKE